MPVSLSRRPSVRKRRKATLAGSCLTLLVFFVLYLGHGRSVSTSMTSTSMEQLAAVPSSPLLEEQARFWRSFYHVILNNDPLCNKSPDIVIPEKLGIPFERGHARSRPDVLWMDNADVQRLKIAHQNFLRDIESSPSNLIYQKGTRGIVTTTSLKSIPIVLTQLHMLRSTNSLLPVEVFLSHQTPYTSHICLEVLAALNATCVFFSDIFKAAGTGVSVESYQYKVLAVLFSSFDEILLLDSDAWPVTNPDHLFTYPPFTETGLVLWPDFWYASESPYYFAIAKIDDPPMLHVKPAIESGQIMYAKSKHERSILLAAYYNYYGPEYYYKLLSQGAPGEGDKETFGSAALVLKEDFYWVKTMVTALGRRDSSGKFLGSAMVQYDPIVDFQNQNALSPTEITLNNRPDRVQEQQDGALPEQVTPPTANKPMFVHANVPKFDPRLIFDDHQIGDVRTSPTRDSNGTFVRCWSYSAESAIELFGYDLERKFWEMMQQVACTDLRNQADFATEEEGTQVCHKVTTYLNTIVGTA